MRFRLPKPEVPLPEELAPFTIAIPTHYADEPIVTRQEVLFGLRAAAHLTPAYSAKKRRTIRVAWPFFATPLQSAYHAWPATETHASLSFVLGTVATPFTLLLLIIAGNRDDMVLTLFREAMIPLLEARGHETRTRGFQNLWEACVQRVAQELDADPVIARLVVANARLRGNVGRTFLSGSLLPWDLPMCLQQPDFHSAARALHAENPFLTLTLLENPQLRSEELAQIFSLVSTTDTPAWERVEAVLLLLKHQALTPAMFAVIDAPDWRHVATIAPEVVGRLWSAFWAEERHWLGVFAALAATPFEFHEHCTHLSDRLARWTPAACALAASLLTSSPVPGTASAGRELLYGTPAGRVPVGAPTGC